MGAAGDQAETVLVADDEEVLLQLMGRILERAGYHVVTVTHGDDALERFREAPQAFSAAVVDVTMPPEGGVAILRKLLAVRSDLRVVLVSGSVPTPEAQHLLESAGGTFVQKPFSPAGLLRAVVATEGGE